ncbi:hypothetical protein TWF696_009780 [Orbilia brochopaga]|uniref:Uncharacterized protein n=1 Tax=Orbilia brochopaga TaxID=3140254 RepID=A0AAV9UF55_9PEZI
MRALLPSVFVDRPRASGFNILTARRATLFMKHELTVFWLSRVELAPGEGQPKSDEAFPAVAILHGTNRGSDQSLTRSCLSSLRFPHRHLQDLIRSRTAPRIEPGHAEKAREGT